MPFADPRKKRAYAAEYARKHYARDRERLLARSREFYARMAAEAKSLGISTREAKKLHRRERREARNSHGLTATQYDRMSALQLGGCAICGMANPTGVRLHVDHEHVDGYKLLSLDDKAKTVRGLLCIACNVFLGLCQDDGDIAERRASAIAAKVRAYLKR